MSEHDDETIAQLRARLADALQKIDRLTFLNARYVERFEAQETLRDRIAIAVLPTMLQAFGHPSCSNMTDAEIYVGVARAAYQFADATLAVRKGEAEEPR